MAKVRKTSCAQSFAQFALGMATLQYYVAQCNFGSSTMSTWLTMQNCTFRQCVLDSDCACSCTVRIRHGGRVCVNNERDDSRAGD
eukprot:1470332-Amphidinium_carterae.1